jgi:hypothetical protein
MIRTVYVISSEEGVRALYNGLVAGLQRQLCFASIRIGLYDNVKQTYINTLHGNLQNFIFSPKIHLIIYALYICLLRVVSPCCRETVWLEKSNLIV